MSVASSASQSAFCATLLDELVVGGVRDVVVCPGSRSTPLALAAAESDVELHVRLDERSAGFFALGLARATTQAVAIIVTSGTAVAELSAAVVEAALDRVPLVVLTADRPPELREIGAPQTIRQQGFFEHHAVFSFDPGPVHALERASWRPLASRLLIEAEGLSGRRGPVHLNVPLIEPLVAEADEIPPRRSGDRRWFEFASEGHSAEDLPRARAHTVVLAGGGVDDPAALLEVAARAGWPVLADPRSGCRLVSSMVVCAADALLRDEATARALAPQTLVLLGAPPASKVVNQWVREMADLGASVIVLGPDGPARHPSGAPATFLSGSDAATLRSLAEVAEVSPETWSAAWRDAERAAQAVLEAELAGELLTEPAVARALSETLEAPTTLVCSSSMPIRDLEWFGAPAAAPARVLANRGANGIDGVVSTALGAASAGTGPVVCLIGDLAFLHDLSALVDGVSPPGSLTIVVVDNAGGGIFSFLPQRTTLVLQRFEQLFGTPPRIDVADAATGLGATVREITRRSELLDALDELLGRPGVAVLVVRAPERDANVATHTALNELVAEAVRGVLS